MATASDGGAMIRRIMTTISALVIAWLGLLGSQPVAAAVPAQAEPTYTYDAQHAGVSAHTRTERGPPAYYHTRATAYDAVDGWSDGYSARPDGARRRPITTYDSLCALAKVARSTTTTFGHAGPASVEVSSLQHWQDAAKTTPEAAAALKGPIADQVARNLPQWP